MPRTDPAIEDYCGAWIAQHLRGIYRHPQHRDHRRPDDRGASAHERPVAGPLRRGLGGCGRAPLSISANGTFADRGPARRIQRGAVRAARSTVSSSARALWSRRCGSMPGVSSVQITFHEEKDPQAPRHAARRFPARRRECLDLQSASPARMLRRISSPARRDDAGAKRRVRLVRAPCPPSMAATWLRDQVEEYP